MQNTVSRFLEKTGMHPENLDPETLLLEFRNEMEAGLAGRPSSLAMIPTFISIHRSIPALTPAIALDAGGTNLRVALVSFDEEGKPQIRDYSRHSMPGYAEELGREAFYDRFVEILLPLAGKAERVGFCFSYPAEISPEGDGRLLTWTKEIKAPEVVGDYIGENICERLEARGFSLRFTLLNDTVATLLAGRGSGSLRQFASYVGFILGTGTNTAYVEQNRNINKRPELDQEDAQAINVESGNFGKAPRSALDRRLDAATTSPGQYGFEKMISGAYLGRLGLLVLHQAHDAGLFSETGGSGIRGLRRLSTPQLGRFLENPQGEGILAGLALTDSDRDVGQHLLSAVVDRAAVLASVNVAAAVLKSGAGRSPLRPVCVNIDGSTFYKTKGLKQRAERCLFELLRSRGVNAELFRIRESPLIGAAIAALTRP